MTGRSIGSASPSPEPAPTSPRPRHIGMVACSSEGAALCYRTICVEASELLGPHAHPEVSSAASATSV